LPALRRRACRRSSRGEEGGGDASAKYADGLPDDLPTAVEGALPFAYQFTGAETRFTNTLDPEEKSHRVFWFHRRLL